MTVYSSREADGEVGIIGQFRGGTSAPSTQNGRGTSGLEKGGFGVVERAMRGPGCDWAALFDEVLDRE